MPESKTRKNADEKKKAKAKAKEELKEAKREAAKLAPRSRAWVPYVFIPVGLLGVLWMVVYNLAANYIPFMIALGGWNVVIGLGLIVASFSLMTLWK